jgi:hypothetical protein
VSTGYQTVPTFAPTSGSDVSSFPPPIDQAQGFGEADFLSPPELVRGGSSSEESGSPGERGFFPHQQQHALQHDHLKKRLGTRRGWDRVQSVPAARSFGFQTERETMDLAMGDIEQEKLQSIVSQFKPRVRGELRAMAEVQVEEGEEAGVDSDMEMRTEQGMGMRTGSFGSGMGQRGMKRQEFKRNGSSDDDLILTDTEGPTFPSQAGPTSLFSVAPDNIPLHMQQNNPLAHPLSPAGRGNLFRPKRELRPTKSLPARVFSAGSGGPMAAPFTPGFFGTGTVGDKEEEVEEDGFEVGDDFGQGMDF